VLLAVAEAAGPAGFDSHAWKLPLAMADFLHLSGQWHDWVTTRRTAIAPARQQGDRAGTALCHCESGRVAIRMRRGTRRPTGSCCGRLNSSAGWAT
jgi:hypothetical protein